jgi:hypothetical protein
MCPRNESSLSSAAQPRPLAGSPSSSPSQANSTHGRPSCWPWWQSIHPLHGDEPELAAAVGAELDEAGSQEVDGLRIPEVHLHDPPGTGHAHRGSSESRSRHAETGHGCSSGTKPTHTPRSVGRRCTAEADRYAYQPCRAGIQSVGDRSCLGPPGVDTYASCVMPGNGLTRRVARSRIVGRRSCADGGGCWSS